MHIKKPWGSLNAQTTPGYATILMYYELEQYIITSKSVIFNLRNLEGNSCM